MSVKYSDFAAASNTLVGGSNQVATPHVFTQPLTVSTNFSACNVYASGRLGAGTTAPSVELDVENGRIRVAQSNVTIGSNAPIYDYSLQLIGNYGTTGERAGMCFTTGNTAMNESNAWTPGAAITYNRTAPGDFRGDLLIKTQGGTNTSNTLSTVMAITSAGRVGINKTNPAYALDVAGDVECDSIVQINTSNPIQILAANPGPLIEVAYNSSNDRYGIAQHAGSGTQLYASGALAGSRIHLGFATNSNASDSRMIITNSTSNIFMNPAGTGSVLLWTTVAGADGACAFQVGINGAFANGANAMFNTVGTSNYGDAANTTVPGVMFRNGSSTTFIHGNRIVMQGGTSSNIRLMFDTVGSQGQINAFDRGASNAVQLNLNATKGGLVYVGSNLQVGSNMLVTGRIGVGTASPAYALQVTTDSAAKPSTTTWTVASDQRIKENIQVADYGLCYSNVQSLDLKRYAYIPAYREATQIQDTNLLGWIAQDVQPIFPKAIHEVDAPEYGLSNMLNVDFDQVYAMMYGALRLAMTKSELLTARIAALELAQA